MIKLANLKLLKKIVDSKLSEEKKIELLRNFKQFKNKPKYYSITDPDLDSKSYKLSVIKDYKNNPDKDKSIEIIRRNLNNRLLSTGTNSGYYKKNKLILKKPKNKEVGYKGITSDNYDIFNGSTPLWATSDALLPIARSYAKGGAVLKIDFNKVNSKSPWSKHIGKNTIGMTEDQVKKIPTYHASGITGKANNYYERVFTAKDDAVTDVLIDGKYRVNENEMKDKSKLLRQLFSEHDTPKRFGNGFMIMPGYGYGVRDLDKSTVFKQPNVTKNMEYIRKKISENGVNSIIDSSGINVFYKKPTLTSYGKEYIKDNNKYYRKDSTL
jgi:hypothetical protein